LITTGASSAAAALSFAAVGTSSIIRTSRLALAIDPSLSVTTTAKLSPTKSSPWLLCVSVLSDRT